MKNLRRTVCRIVVDVDKLKIVLRYLQKNTFHPRVQLKDILPFVITRSDDGNGFHL